MDFVEQIKNLQFGNINDAFILYKEYIAFLNTKYGYVDRDYTDNPTKRGLEWIDIHHILEYNPQQNSRQSQIPMQKSWLKSFPLSSIIPSEYRDRNKTYST